MKAIVIGAGIGGLAAAIALGRAGVAVEVYERAPALGEVCQALEDAVVLGDCLRETPDVVQALRSYQARRLPRTTAIVERSCRIGQMGQWEHPVACWLRNTVVRAAPAGLHLRQLASIIGHRV